ncbi:DUF3526 domain-containing protein [Arcicella sp. LKC2W]|uniref:ABC transporter permease n=1 Tax=Arcicella sp. LKC2W TaxID=2984198 RepID=UPI002B20EE7F|nr:DUF3526 domain-containing protein [Arcicella sp. LKC2W]MEA5460891.1 DUF3526 domain-containing protein [Arcicella sp. LKC2W]
MSPEILIAQLFIKTVLNNKAIGILAFFIIGLFIFAMYSGWENFETQHEMKRKYQAQSRKDWLDNPDKHPHRMAHYGNFAFRPKSSLSIFDFGMESFLGNSIYLEAHKQNSVNFSEAGFSTGMLRFGEISIAMILQTLLPLLIFFIGFGSISSERENSTLKILLSQGVSWKQLILGKSYGLIGGTMVLFIPLILTFFIVWINMKGTNISLDEILRLLLIIILYSIYLSIFCVITVLISAISKTSKTALTSLIGLWLMLTLVLPRVSQTIGKAFFPTPPKATFEMQIDKDITKVGDSHNPQDPYFKALKDSLLAVYQVDSVQKLPFNYGGYQMKIGEQISSNIYQKHQQKLMTIYEQQNSLSKVMAFFNPFMAIKNISMSLSNTDFRSFVDFQEQAEQYRYKMAQAMNDLQIKFINNKSKSSADKKQIINKKHWEHLHEFEYKPLNITQVFKNEFVSIAAFLFWIFVLKYFINVLSKTLKAI